MRVVTVARKPCSEGSTTANVVEHHAGAINVDACRISYASETDKTPTVGHGDFRREPGIGAELPHHKEGWGQWEVNHTGRWPANVILVHCSGCAVVGERRVPTGKAVRERSGGKTIFSETDKKPLPNMTYADENGRETVPMWSCEPGCPVASMDAQTGVLTSGSGTVKRSSGRERKGNRGAAYGAENRPDGTPMIFYGDTGGASRFFKQFGGDHGQ